MLAVWLRVPLVAVTVRGYVPGAVAAIEVRVRVELPVPVTVVGLNPGVTPAGNPVRLKPMEPLKPFSALVFTV